MGKKKNIEESGKTKILPLFTLENFSVTPILPQPVKIENEEQKRMLDKISGANSEIFLVMTDGSSNDINNEKINEIGIIGIIDRVLQMPGAPTLAFIRPTARARFEGLVFSPAYPMARVKPLSNVSVPKRKSSENKIMLQRVEDLFDAVMKYLGEQENEAARKLISENSRDPITYLYAISHVSPITAVDKNLVLSCNTYSDLLTTIVSLLDEAEQKIALQASIHERTHHELSQQQKEVFLRTHLKQIKEELGEGEDNEEVAELIAKASDKKWSKQAEQHFNKELQKLRRLNINNPEYSVQYSYLEAFLDLPWENYKNKKISIEKVEEILNRDHYGLQEVKERIMEYMAVVKLRNDLKAPILCLYGPPGVGKTSIGKSVAEATGREYARIALGGMHDESEIRGHRRTYIGAMPGRFLHSLSKLKYGNPLILLDEIDKVGKDFKGDPSSALLEALDPEQNNTFHDNFIDFPYDLSKVLFIATANDLSSIPDPLKDRMEIIEMPKYNLDEKREIALRHLVDKALVDNGFKKGEIQFLPESIDTIIRFHTKEAGVRQLAKKINAIIRKIALQKVRGNKIPKKITKEIVSDLIGKKSSSYNNLGFKA